MHSLFSILSALIVYTAPPPPVVPHYHTPEKVIVIAVDEKGLVYWGRDTITIIEITEELHVRLWKSFLGTSKMPGMILVNYSGSASSKHQEATEKAIREAQQKNPAGTMRAQIQKKIRGDQQ